MNKFENKIIKKEIRKVNLYFFYFIFFLIICILVILIGTRQNNNNKDNYVYLNDVIESKNNKENLNTYLDIADTPYSIAKYENEEDHAFYIVFDNRYFYIAYLNDDIYNKLNVENLSDNPIRIYGTTAKIPDEVKDIALEVYNEGLDEENQIEMEDFNSYFGEVYLNNASLKKGNNTYYIISIIPLIISLSTLIIFIIKKIKIKKVINSLSEEEIEKIEKEIDEEGTTFYSKYHLILTKNYIITFNSNLNIIKYNELIWIYENRVKQYGITTNIFIFIMTNKGKTINLINTDGITKKAKNIRKEIIEQITNKNNNILVGMNKKNKEEIKNILKDS